MNPANTLLIEQAFISLGGRQILQGACIKISHGQITGLLGSNGSGKSTMLKMLFGSLGGEKLVSVNGKVLKRPAYSYDGVLNYLPQFSFLPSGMRMKKLMQVFKVNPEEAFTAFPELAKDVNLHAGQLSGGEARLWQTLLLLYAPTKFTLLDEPFTHLTRCMWSGFTDCYRNWRQRKVLC